MPTLNKTITHLNRLQTTCQDGQQTCRQLAANAQALPLRCFLTEREQEYGALIACLHSQITTYGGRPTEHISLAGLWRHCWWYEVKALIVPVDDRTRLNTALELETQVRRGFETLLAQELSPEFRQQLAEHHQRVLERTRQLQTALEQWPHLGMLKTESGQD
ncbi:PA2169 family four-helix-bundle protein [Pseudomonas berkeleyensis]|uniref:PA2169 family four-helix-bundle protein n=1 Tax=Pseudomonas berkeleyensis TaxID=2726956 RepID=A0A7G5DW09_9PSED|nr:PA2169 family four-helix-bundle protein [Pseudomonas berkeleyensis]QMV65934.1 PA2169 family four-helix-bundle protein [Pseudomonas berkeleyensis]WSO41423.1 PA2169 family four-helix-bundle protein [Pseudomonas berkeleyensis]